MPSDFTLSEKARLVFRLIFLSKLNLRTKAKRNWDNIRLLIDCHCSTMADCGSRPPYPIFDMASRWSLNKALH